MSPSEGAASSIKTFTSIPAEETSHISSVGADVSARSTISSSPSPPPPVDFSTISSKSSRPRPRPIFSRGVDRAPNASVSDPVFPHVFGSDHGDQPAIGSHSDPTVTRETTQNMIPDLNNFSPDIAERAKMRARRTTKRSSPYAEDVIDITDDELAVTPVRKPKERIKPRPIKRATPVANSLQLNSDPATVPVPSSSPLLPPSDLFPDSTVVNSTPPRPHPLDKAATPDSPSQGSPTQPRKRKRAVRLHSPEDGLSDSNCPLAVPDRVMSPRPDSLPPFEGVVDVVDPGRNLNSDKKSSEDGYEKTETSKKRKTSKVIVEVVIKSPRKRRKESKKAKAKKKDGRNPEGNDTESRNDHWPSSSSPAEQMHNNVHADSDDELILAPKRQPASKVKPQKGKQKKSEPHFTDSDALSDVDPSNKQVVTGEEEGEEPRNDEQHAEGAYMPESLAPLPVSLISISIASIADSTSEKTKHNIFAQEDDSPKPSPTRGTPASGKLRYSLSSKTDRKTPMQELIRRAASHSNAPFSSPASPVASPLAKTSKSALRRIAPLHLTRRTPPPPPPRPPPPKKSKKMLALEEKWELELEDEVEGWWALTNEERQDWRRSKRDKELGCDD